MAGDSDGAISYRDVMPRLVAATTLYRSSPEAATLDHYDAEYLHAGALVTYLVRRLAAGETGEFPGLFAVVEEVLERGDDRARDLIDSFFDVLTNLNVYSEFAHTPVEFLEWMGPLALRTGWIRQLYE